jgi:hypothetical protein
MSGGVAGQSWIAHLFQNAFLVLEVGFDGLYEPASWRA